MSSGAFFSSDASAPALNNVAGSLIGVLDACLINGYGAKSAVGGWDKVYTGTNKAVYRSTTGNRFYLRIDDTDTDVARVTAYESMTTVDDGVDPFPTSLQVSGGLYVRKTNGGGGGWGVYANSRCFYFLPTVSSSTYSATTTNDAGGQFFFGEFVSYRSGDAFNTALIASPASTLGVGYFANHSSAAITGQTTIPGHYVARNFAGLLKSHRCSKYNGKFACDPGSGSTSRVILGEYGNFLLSYPDPVSGKIPLARVHVIESLALTNSGQTGHSMRGYLPGIWCPMASGFAHGDTFDGSDMLSGKSFIAVGAHGLYANESGPIAGTVVFETSNTW